MDREPMDERIKIVLEEIDPSDKVLDLGCVHEPGAYRSRSDWLHGYLVERAKYVLGIDIDEEGIKELRKAGYNVIKGDVEDLKLDEKFDVVVAGELIEHLSNPGKFLDNIRSLLRDENSKLLISTPNVWCILNMIGALINRVAIHEDHKCWYDEMTVK